MADPEKKCKYILNLDESLDTFSNGSCLFNDGSVYLTFRNEKNAGTKIVEQKLNSNINLREIWNLEVGGITDYKLVHDSEIKNNGTNIADRNNKNK